MHLSQFLLIPLAFMLTVGNVHAADIARAQPTGRLIVNFNPDQDQTAGLGRMFGDSKRTDSLHRPRWRKSQHLRLSRRLSAYSELVEVEAGTSAASLTYLANKLSEGSAVASASVEYKRFPLVHPNDPLFERENGDSGAAHYQDYLFEGDYSVRAPGAWDITTGSQTTVIAVVDTGVLPNHPELQMRGIEGMGYDFVSADAPDDFYSANDGDGRDADPTDPGDSCQSNPSSWHGTGVASVAAGNANNALGIAGIDWNTRLLHARALGRCGGTDADIIDAIRWSAGLPISGLPLNTQPATVVNLSIGGPTECTPAWQNVIEELNELGIPFVIASGNEAYNALRSSPANCANVITVGSNKTDGDLDGSFSNYGLKVTVTAPGRDILMATNNGLESAVETGHDYQRETGTSFSAAMVSGAISLMQSLNGDLSPSTIRSILQQSVTPFASDGDCATYYCGTGIVNLSRAMQMVRDGSYEEDTNTELSVVTTQMIPFDLNLPVEGSLFGYRDIRYYKLTVDRSGMLSITSDSDADLYGYLLTDRFSVLALDDDSHTGFNFKVASRVEAGDYYIAVERSVNRLSSREATYALSANLTTDQPAPFSFNPLQNANVSSAVTSEQVRISDLENTAIVTITGGFYSINDQPLTNAQGQVNNGDTLRVSLQSAPALNTETSLTLTIGAFATDFVVTTGNRPSSAVPAETQSGRGGCALQTHTAAIDPLLPALLLLAFCGTVRLRFRR